MKLLLLSLLCLTGCASYQPLTGYNVTQFDPNTDTSNGWCTIQLVIDPEVTCSKGESFNSSFDLLVGQGSNSFTLENKIDKAGSTSYNTGKDGQLKATFYQSGWISCNKGYRGFISVQKGNQEIRVQANGNTHHLGYFTIYHGVTLSIESCGGRMCGAVSR